MADQSGLGAPFEAKYWGKVGFGTLFSSGHQGTDYDLPNGSPLFAMTDGIIVRNTAWGSQGGNPGWAATVKNTAGGSIGSVLYGHIGKFNDSHPDGSQVKAGDLIGWSGGLQGQPGAGHSSGAHVHLQISDASGQWVDPQKVLSGFNWASVAAGQQVLAQVDNFGNPVAAISNGLLGGITGVVGRVVFVFLGIVIIVIGAWVMFRPEVDSAAKSGGAAMALA